MDKKEILARSHEKGPDERERKIYLDAYNFSGILSVLLCLLLIAYSVAQDMPFYQYSVLIFADIAATYLYRFAHIRTRRFLLIGLGALLLAVVACVLFWMHGR